MNVLIQIKQYLRAVIIYIRRMLKFRTQVNVSKTSMITEYGSHGYHVFFGYHDFSPFNDEEQLLLATRCPVTNTSKAAGTILELGVFNTSLHNPVFETFAITSTWCWQQGCRLQWYPHNSKKYVFFNKTVDNKHTSCIYDISKSVVVKDYERALYSLSYCGKFGVSLNFSRLQRLRPGYGYDDVDDITLNVLSPTDDGLWLLDLDTGKSQLILALSEVAAFETESSMKDAAHYFNHILWSPDNNYFFFLHLWLTPDGSRHSRACIWNVKSNSFSLLGPHNIVSHHCWVDNERIIVFTNEADAGMRYYLYDIHKGLIEGVGINYLHEDGHPSISPIQPDLMVTDTYPNNIGEQSLYIFNMKDNVLELIAELYSPMRYRGEKRCDLHPRWNNNGNKICVDSAHSGERKLYVFDVSNIVKHIIN